MDFYNELVFSVDGPADREAFADCLEAIVTHICELAPQADADFGATLAGPVPQVTFSLTVTADDSPAALGKALALLRTAIHASGGETPGWEDAFTALQHTVRPYTMESEPA